MISAGGGESGGAPRIATGGNPTGGKFNGAAGGSCAGMLHHMCVSAWLVLPDSDTHSAVFCGMLHSSRHCAEP